MNWKTLYRALVDIRNALNRLIAFVRGKAYPRLAKHAADQAQEPQP
jgi:hypothetical protein